MLTVPVQEAWSFSYTKVDYSLLGRSDIILCPVVIN